MRDKVLMISTSCAIIVIVATVGTVFAQVAPTAPPTIPNPTPEATLRSFFTNRTPYEFWLTCIIGMVALTIIGALIWAVGRTANPRPEDVTRPVIVIAVIFSTLILVTAGYSNDQIAPAFGLFGTIVGYLLGRTGPAAAPVTQTSSGANAEAGQNTPQIVPAPATQPTPSATPSVTPAIAATDQGFPR
jgi:glycerol uptake facilitator-like aquaporin